MSVYSHQALPSYQGLGAQQFNSLPRSQALFLNGRHAQVYLEIPGEVYRAWQTYSSLYVQSARKRLYCFLILSVCTFFSGSVLGTIGANSADRRMARLGLGVFFSTALLLACGMIPSDNRMVRALKALQDDNSSFLHFLRGKPLNQISEEELKCYYDEFQNLNCCSRIIEKHKWDARDFEVL